MFKALLHVGIWLTPFFYLPGMDIRTLKMTAAVVISSAIVAAGLYSKGIKPFKNKWLLLLLAYIPLSIYMAPTPQIKLVGIDVASFWAWEPFLHILLFSITAMVIASQEFEWIDVDLIMKSMMYAGAITAGYMILQFWFVDQFFKPVDSFIPGRGHVSGFIGNPTLVAPFVAMTIPIAFYFKRYVAALTMFVAVLMTNSQVGYGAMIVSLLFLVSTKGKWRALASIAILAICAAFVIANPKFAEPHERFTMWKQIAIDIKSPVTQESDAPYPLTGRGLGSFKFVFHQQHPGTEMRPNRFLQAHNDPLEFAYCAGIVGFVLAMLFVIKMFLINVNFKKYLTSWHDSRKATLLASFLCVFIASFGTFVFQIGTIAFYSVVLIGLLHNETV